MEQHTGDIAAGSIAEAARAAAGTQDRDAFETLKASVQSASPNERSAAAKDLVDDEAAYEALHRALQELGIEE